MTVAKQIEIRDNIKKYFDLAFEGETVFVPRKNNKNVYVISQKEYEMLQKAKRNAEYINMLDHSIAQLDSGDVIRLSIGELRGMESDG